MSRPICVECRVEYSCDKNEVLVNDPAVGGFPATYWYADRWKCPGCKHKIIVGRGKPLHQRYVLPDNSFEFNHSLQIDHVEQLEAKDIR